LANLDEDIHALTTDRHELMEWVGVDSPENPQYVLDDNAKERVIIDVIHDGHWLPQEFLVDGSGEPITLEKIAPDYIRERDWGASLIAEAPTQRLGLGKYARVNVARVLLDFARFPGSTLPDADHLHRFAINYPFSELLSYRQKKQVLEDYYDGISDAFDSYLEGRLVKIAVHTYDQYNDSGTERPAMSLMTRSFGYQTTSEMPAGLFDPLYPAVLAEFTADRVLRDRMSLTLEKARIPVAHNYPYLLPDGSLEVRYQVWAFFGALRDAFEAEYPETKEDRAFQMVWEMLFDTNLRSSDSEALRSYLHMYRRPPGGFEDAFARAEDAYEAVERFSAKSAEFIERYRFSRKRTSSIAIEVRKDLLCELGADGAPVGIRHDNIRVISEALADAVSTYFREDHDIAHATSPADAIARHDPWYLGDT
jgi:hypothetical protein